jgi:hypothetical protein
MSVNSEVLSMIFSLYYYSISRDERRERYFLMNSLVNTSVNDYNDCDDYYDDDYGNWIY